ncbi:MAG: hypothetical protein OXI67_02260 [Candidatus Poribacteria bacterium]|nr:hypothetical protein [Candidatus Poribacteria bacterium]
MTDDKIYHLGIDTLVKKLGPPATIRFLTQIEPPTGDYTSKRHEWLDSLPDMDTLVSQIKQSNKEDKAGRNRISKLKTEITRNGKHLEKRAQKIPDQDLFSLGLEFLTDELGIIGTLRFIRLCEPDRGVYAIHRHKHPELDCESTRLKQKNDRKS